MHGWFQNMHGWFENMYGWFQNIHGWFQNMHGWSHPWCGRSMLTYLIKIPQKQALAMTTTIKI